MRELHGTGFQNSGSGSWDSLAPSVHPLGMREPLLPGCLLAVECALPTVFLCPLTSAPVACSVKESLGPQAKGSYCPPPSPGQGWLFGEECWPPPQPCPDSCLRFYCFHSLPYMEVGLASLRGERLQQAAPSPQLTGTPWLPCKKCIDRDRVRL